MHNSLALALSCLTQGHDNSLGLALYDAPVIRKWHLGVGMRLATRPMRSLFMYPGYRRVVVDAAITVETREFS